MTTAKREDLLAKLEALLEMTTKNGCTEAEAALAAEKAQLLMDKHGLSLKDLRAASPTDLCAGESVVAGRRKTHEVQYCCQAIATFTETKVWASRASGEIVIRFYGIQNDVSIAVFLFKTFQQAIDFEWTRYWAQQRFFTEMRAKTMRRSFTGGMCQRINERLGELIRTREKKVDPENDCLTIVVVKKDVVERAFRTLDLKLNKGSQQRTPIRSRGAYDAGREAGDHVGFYSGELE